MIELGLIGWPLVHSKSPTMHKAALEALGLAGNYRLFPIKATEPEHLINTIHRVRIGELTGLNVTIPHKQAVLELIDNLTPTAKAIGAVNTIFVEAGELIGHNTDAQGFEIDLKKHLGKKVNDRLHCLVLGAGGSARAVVWTLAGLFDRVVVAARRVDQAQNLVNFIDLDIKRCGKTSAILLSTETIDPYINQIDLIVNTTPIGMYPQVDSTPWPDRLSFPRGAIIYDLVYNPNQTLLLKEAIRGGLEAVSGIGMLVEQAALSFELWTGERAPREVMLKAVLETFK